MDWGEAVAEGSVGMMEQRALGLPEMRRGVWDGETSELCILGEPQQGR